MEYINSFISKYLPKQETIAKDDNDFILDLKKIIENSKDDNFETLKKLIKEPLFLQKLIKNYVHDDFFCFKDIFRLVDLEEVINIIIYLNSLINNVFFSDLFEYKRNEKMNNIDDLYKKINSSKLNEKDKLTLIIYLVYYTFHNDKLSFDLIVDNNHNYFKEIQTKLSSYKEDLDLMNLINNKSINDLLHNDSLKKYKCYEVHKNILGNLYINLKNEINDNIIKEKETRHNYLEMKNLLIDINKVANIHDMIEKFEKLKSILAFFGNINNNSISFSKKIFESLEFNIDQFYITQIRDYIIDISDKKIIVIDDNDIDLNVIKQIHSIAPNIRLSFLQYFYDQFLIYLNNKNFNLFKNNSMYSLELNKQDKISNFSNFVDMITDLYLVITHFSEIFNCDVYINFEIYYSGSIKVGSNSFIFVFSYNIQQYYQQFRENLDKSNLTEKDLEKYSNIFENYKRICDRINNDHNLNLKFYDIDMKSNNEINSSFTKIVLNFKKYIDQSCKDIECEQIARTNNYEILKEVFEINLQEKFTEIQNNNLLSLLSEIQISLSFKLFIKEMINFIITNQNENDITSNLKLIFSLLHSFYDVYFQLNSNNSDMSQIIIIHNNIQCLIFILNVYSIFNNLNSKLNEYLKNVKIFFKNYASNILSHVFANFINELSSEIIKVESFEDIRFERNTKKIDKMLKSCNELLIKFFNFFREYANEKDFFFNLNYTLSLYFDLLNKRILNIQDYQDLKITEKLFSNFSSDLKKQFEHMFIDRYRLEFLNILENNVKYKKFEEIILIIKASSLDKIDKFLKITNYRINIDSNELIELLCTIFSESKERDNLIKNIKIIK